MINSHILDKFSKGKAELGLSADNRPSKFQFLRNPATSTTHAKMGRKFGVPAIA